MIGGLIVTHGRLAIELLNAAEMIVGEIHHITAVSLGWHDDVGMATSMIEKALDRTNRRDGEPLRLTRSSRVAEYSRDWLDTQHLGSICCDDDHARRPVVDA